MFESILVHGVFRWRNPLLEQITFCRYPYLFTYIQTDRHAYIQVRTYMHTYVYVYTCIRWRNPHLEQITFCRYP